MKYNLKILHLEDLESDIELVANELKKGNFQFKIHTVDNKKDYLDALNTFKPDIILSDHSMPAFNSLEALDYLNENNLNIPFILITSTISEEFAVEIMLKGAWDYILKDRLQRLPKAVENAYNKWHAEVEKQKYFEKIIADDNLLKESQRIANLGNWETDFISGKTIWSNETFKILGLLPGVIEPSLEQFFSFIHPEDLNFVKHQLSEAQETYKNIIFNCRIIRKDGDVRYIFSKTNYLFLNSKEPSKLQGIIQDITERRLAEMEREFDTNNLKALINNTNDLMWSINNEGTLITSNKAFDNMVKLLSGNEVVKGEIVPRFGFSEEQLERWDEYYRRAFSGELFTIIEYTKSPIEIWSEISFYPIYRNLNVIGTACFSRNITERKLFEIEMEKYTNELFQIKEKLEHSENRLKQAQTLAHLGNWELNFSNQNILISDETCSILGRNLTDNIITIDIWKSYIHPEDLATIENLMESTRITLEDLSLFHRIIRSDGEIRYLYFESRYDFDEYQKPISLFGVILDITERKKDEQDLYDLLKVSTDQNLRLQNFAYIVSHNIRSHSANISGILDSIKICSNHTDKSKLMGMLDISAAKLSETIENLNEIITIQNAVILKKVAVNLKEEILKTFDAINSMIFETGAKIIINIDDKINIEVVPSYLESILLNILSNAIKYRAPERKPEINISLASHYDYHILSIEDNGIGIDLFKNADKIFGMYKTFHTNKDARGFGLFITKNQIEVMGGKIEVSSTIGIGSVFRVYFKV